MQRHSRRASILFALTATTLLSASHGQTTVGVTTVPVAATATPVVGQTGPTVPVVVTDDPSVASGVPAGTVPPVAVGQTGATVGQAGATGGQTGATVGQTGGVASPVASTLPPVGTTGSEAPAVPVVPEDDQSPAIGLRLGCTPRCASTDAPGQWRTDEVAGYSNTFELEDPHTCHFHAYSQREVSECMVDEETDVIFLGDSTAAGMAASIMPWFAPVYQGGSGDFDILDWFAEYGITTYAEDVEGWGVYTDLAAAQMVLMNTGVVLYNSALTTSVAEPFDSLMKGSPSIAEGQSSIYYFGCKTFECSIAALEALNSPERVARRAVIHVSIGEWWYYCSQLGNDYCGDMGAEGAALEKMEGAEVLTLYENRLRGLVARIRSTFPMFVIIFSDYGFSHVNIPFTDGMSAAIKRAVTSVEDAHFLDVYRMVNTVNAPPMIQNRLVHSVNHALFQRIISVTCPAPRLVECEEEIIGSVDCQYESFADRIGNNTDSWYLQWYRTCNLDSIVQVGQYENFASTAAPTAKQSFQLHTPPPGGFTAEMDGGSFDADFGRPKTAQEGSDSGKSTMDKDVIGGFTVGTLVGLAIGAIATLLTMNCIKNAMIGRKLRENARMAKAPPQPMLKRKGSSAGMSPENDSSTPRSQDSSQRGGLYVKRSVHDPNDIMLHDKEDENSPRLRTVHHLNSRKHSNEPSPSNGFADPSPRHQRGLSIA